MVVLEKRNNFIYLKDHDKSKSIGFASSDGITNIKIMLNFVQADEKITLNMRGNWYVTSLIVRNNENKELYNLLKKTYNIYYKLYREYKSSYDSLNIDQDFINYLVFCEKFNGKELIYPSERYYKDFKTLIGLSYKEEDYVKFSLYNRLYINIDTSLDKEIVISNRSLIPFIFALYNGLAKDLECMYRENNNDLNIKKEDLEKVLCLR